MTLVCYEFDKFNIYVSYPNDNVGRSFEVEASKIPPGFVWHDTNQSAWKEELEKDKYQKGDKYGRDRLDKFISPKGYVN